MHLSQSNSFVEDEEILYRSVRLADGGYKLENGVYQISSSAFNDRNMQPSVDRAQLKNNNPEQSRKSKTDCVVSLKTLEIRNETIERNEINYILDVKPDPTDENPAHAIVVPSPEYKNEKAFRKVKERLARIATVTLTPIK